ncbi:hypothetical protein ACWCQP_36790 [Streptomyces chartreusis]
MNPHPTHAEYVAAELEARAALRDIWSHGYIGDSGPHRYAAAAGDLADSLADNPGTRTVTALAAHRAHPAAGRIPTPSAKAARAALRALNLLGPARRREHDHAAALIHQATSDTIADAFHHAHDAHGLPPHDVIDLAGARTHGAFPTHTSPDVRALVCLVGDLIALARAYGLDEESVICEATDHFHAERPDDTEPA